MALLVLPPVRCRVPLLRSTSGETGRRALAALFPDSRIELLESGTQSLALALQRVAAKHQASAPEAILPAYACPDLLTACVQAGVSPRLVDVNISPWGYDARQLEAALNSNTVAVVAVNLLGLGDGAQRIKPYLAQRDIALIHDSAQYLPCSAENWTGDFVVLSFGRGKPMNLLYGGALISRGASSEMPFGAMEPAVDGRRVSDSSVAAALFNAATHPLIYGVISRVPALHVGATRYKQPNGIRYAGESCWMRVAPALQQFQRARSATELWREALGQLHRHEVESMLDAALLQRMLRLPLLARDRGHRDSLVRKLNARGLGASPMYAQSLPHIPGVPAVAAAQGPFPLAEELAGRLFTLPTHDLVRPRHVRMALECMARA